MVGSARPVPVRRHTRALPGTISSWLLDRRFRVLMYHSISDDTADHLAVPPSLLGDQIDALAVAGYRLETVATAVADWQAGRSVCGVVALSFDDALEDFVAQALPVLQARNAPATLFAPLGELGTYPTWAASDRPRRLLTIEELRELAARGVEVACHGWQHVRLARLDAPELHRQLALAAAAVSQLGRFHLRGFAYPYGDASEGIRRSVRNAGFDYALLAGGLWGNGRASDPWALTRIPISASCSADDIVRAVSPWGDARRLLRDTVTRLSAGRPNTPFAMVGQTGGAQA